MAVLYDPENDAGQSSASETSAQSLRLQLQLLTVRKPEEFEKAFANAQKSQAGGLIVMSSQFFYSHRTRLVALAAKHRLPTIYHHKEYVVGSGGLMSYGADFHDLFRRAAGYVDKILKGAKPLDLPVEQATRFEFVINLKTARALGLTVPQSLLARDRIDELPSLACTHGGRRTVSAPVTPVYRRAPRSHQPV